MAYKKIIFFCHDLFSYLNSSVAIIGGKHAAQPGLAKPLSVEGAGSLKKTAALFAVRRVNCIVYARHGRELMG